MRMVTRRTSRATRWIFRRTYAVDWDAVALIPADVENLTSDSRFELPGVKGRFKIDGGIQDLNTGAPSWQPGLIELQLTRIG